MNFNGSRFTATNYMKVALNVERTTHLPEPESIRQALRQLSTPNLTVTLPWLDKNFNGTRRNASNYMKVASNGKRASLLKGESIRSAPAVVCWRGNTLRTVLCVACGVSCLIPNLEAICADVWSGWDHRLSSAAQFLRFKFNHLYRGVRSKQYHQQNPLHKPRSC